jgi:membrane protein implicated in regulation of membrane protease activity
MYLVAIAWIYVALMMSVAEASSPDGTVVGAVGTFLLYGVGPLSVVLYILGTPARRRRQRQQEAGVVADPGDESEGPDQRKVPE